ncbi:MAG TPA: hypothetical protein VFE05_12005, partial [Longimicrobiaceae bacterium]|nr:hypothetical protein [Longimicrobiaceae bacterium]
VQPLTSIPQDLIFSTQLDTLQRKLSIRFPLLNPHDEIRFSILVSSWDPAFRASARIAGVRELGVTQASASARSKALHLPWTVYFVATITTICLLLLLFGFLHWGIEIALRNTHVMGILSIPQGHTAQELQTKLSGFFMPTKSAREMEPVLGYLRGFPPDHVLIPLEHQQMNVQLGRALENVRSTKYSLILLALVSILGLAYVLRAVYG